NSLTILRISRMGMSLGGFPNVSIPGRCQQFLTVTARHSYTVGMTEEEHREKIQSIQTETAEIQKRIVELDEQIRRQEVQNKKDIGEAQSRFDAWEDRFDKGNDPITKKINHIAKLAGITYEELDNLDNKIIQAGHELAHPRGRSTLS